MFQTNVVDKIKCSITFFLNINEIFMR